ELGPFFRAIQAAQTAELIRFLYADDNVQVVVGDFNSSPDDGPLVDCAIPDGVGGVILTDCPTPYYLMGQATYVDVWLERRGRWSPGYTCCQDTLLDNRVSQLDERIDLIWVRQAPDHYGGPVVRGVRADVIGEEPGDRTAIDQLWPSDHAGVSAGMTLRVPR
ncbi:MAG TPA: endonuclease/exonuclease/phosphatase family protein, partial [Woeseiaceae bacterium]|nr:endonuclease/exonuclease/phosphatase family protein [Woeseiaceae bacterium]